MLKGTKAVLVKTTHKHGLIPLTCNPSPREERVFQAGPRLHQESLSFKTSKAKNGDAGLQWEVGGQEDQEFKIINQLHNTQFQAILNDTTSGLER